MKTEYNRRERKLRGLLKARYGHGNYRIDLINVWVFEGLLSEWRRLGSREEVMRAYGLS